MTAWVFWVVGALAAMGVVMALVRRPGVVLYDWCATRARRPATADQTQLDDDAPKPATQAG